MPRPLSRTPAIQGIVVAVLAVCFAMTLTGCGLTDVGRFDRELSQEIHRDFGAYIESIAMTAGLRSVRVDLRTNLAAEAASLERARPMASAAAQASAILDEYPTVTIKALVWPKEGEVPLVVATASYEGGKLASPIEVEEPATDGSEG